MSSQQVGFQFQGDVIGGASLVHAATGRLLKALSDGGVDFYAVSATVQLGKTIPIQPSQERGVSRLLASRGSRTGFLAKALSIGWGHSDVAIELARTRAGASALLTVGALVTGSTNYTAAHALSELMILGGCEPDYLPTVDVLKSMVAYLAPFMFDSGFSKIFEHIVSASISACGSLGRYIPDGLISTGEAPEWAGAMKHLISTATHGETAYLRIKQRGAWLAAYATHILCMAVKIRVKEGVVWESAGSRGSVILQLDEFEPQPNRTGSQNDLELVCVAGVACDTLRLGDPQTEEGRKPMEITYALTEALAIELRLDARFSESINAGIRKAMLGLIRQSSRCLLIGTKHTINGHFQSEKLLQDVSQQIGIMETSEEVFDLEAQHLRDNTRIQQMPGGRWLNDATTFQIHDACGFHGDGVGHPQGFGCFCKRVCRLIVGFAATATALMQCVYDPLFLRVSADTINGKRETGWTQAISRVTPYSPTEVAPAEILLHLSQLVHGNDAVHELDGLPLAVSAGHCSIYSRCILNRECYDTAGRTLAIESGRISLKRTMRKMVRTDGRTGPSFISGSSDGTSNTYLPGLSVAPHYAGEDVGINMECSLGENEIWLSCFISSKHLPMHAVDISKCRERLLTCIVPPPCQHGHDKPLIVSKQMGLVVVSTFFTSCSSRSLSPFEGVQFFALAGCSIEQMLQLAYLPREYSCLQGDACLQCAVRFLKYSGSNSLTPEKKAVYIIMT